MGEYIDERDVTEVSTDLLSHALETFATEAGVDPDSIREVVLVFRNVDPDGTSHVNFGGNLMAKPMLMALFLSSAAASLAEGAMDQAIADQVPDDASGLAA